MSAIFPSSVEILSDHLTILLLMRLISNIVIRMVADVNCLAPASLTLALLPSLQASPLQSTTSQSAVVVNVASSAHIRASVPLSFNHHQLSSCFKEALTPTGIAAQDLDLNRDQ